MIDAQPVPVADPNCVKPWTQIVSEKLVDPLGPGDQVIAKFRLPSACLTAGTYCVVAEVNAVPDERNTDNNMACASLTVVPAGSVSICRPEGGHVDSPGDDQIFPYAWGKEVPVRAVAHDCHHFAHWTGTAVDSGKVLDPNDPNTTVLVDSHYTLCPVFAKNLVTLSVSSAGCGTTEPNAGTHEYICGSVVPIKATPCECYRFTGWSGTAVDANKVADPNSPNTTATVDANFSLQANFEPRTCTLTIRSDDGGSVTEPGEGEFLRGCGTPVSVKAVADQGYRFNGWAGTCRIDLNETMNPNIEVACIGDCTLMAHFTPICGLTITHADGGHVEPYEGPREQECGASVTATATAESCYDFSHWTGSAVPQGKEGDNPITVQAEGTHDLCAHFVQRKYTLTLSSTEGGRTSVSPDPCEVSDGNGYVYGCGTCPEITPEPEGCYTFSHWSGTAVDTSKVSPNDPHPSLCMDGDYTLTANFVRAVCNLTIVSGPGGIVVPDHDPPYYCGEQIKVTAVADKYCRFEGWAGTCLDPCDVANPEITVTCIDDCLLKAAFTCESRALDVSATPGGYLNVRVVEDDKATTWLGAGTYHFRRGTLVTVEAWPEPGYEFTHWSGMIWSTDTPLEIVLDDDCQLTANFDPIVQP